MKLKKYCYRLVDFHLIQYVSSVSKESLCNAGDQGSIPGSGRSPGEGHGDPLQYSCLENSMDRGAWQANTTNAMTECPRSPSLFAFTYILLWASHVAYMVKNMAAMQETRLWSLGLGRSLGEGNGNPLQYSCLENSMDRGAWWATVHELAKIWTQLSN